MTGFVQVALLVAVATLAGCRAPERQDGASIFGAICARCHGPDGRGEPTAKLQLGVPDMTSATWQERLSDDDIRRTVREGSKSKKMPAFGESFTAAQLDAIVRQVRALGRRR